MNIVAWLTDTGLSSWLEYRDIMRIANHELDWLKDQELIICLRDVCVYKGHFCSTMKGKEWDHIEELNEHIDWLIVIITRELARRLGVTLREVHNVRKADPRVFEEFTEYMRSNHAKSLPSQFKQESLL